MNDLSVQEQMLQQLTYSDGRTLKDVLDTEAYAALETYTAGVGMPLMMLEQFKPGMIVSTLQVLNSNAWVLLLRVLMLSLTPRL